MFLDKPVRRIEVVAGMASWLGTVQAVTLAHLILLFKKTMKSKLMILQKCFV